MRAILPSNSKLSFRKQITPTFLIGAKTTFPDLDDPDLLLTPVTDEYHLCRDGGALVVLSDLDQDRSETDRRNILLLVDAAAPQQVAYLFILK